MSHWFHLVTCLAQMGRKNDVPKRIPWPYKYAWFWGAKVIIVSVWYPSIIVQVEQVSISFVFGEPSRLHMLWKNIVMIASNNWLKVFWSVEDIAVGLLYSLKQKHSRRHFPDDAQMSFFQMINLNRKCYVTFWGRRSRPSFVGISFPVLLSSNRAMVQFTSSDFRLYSIAQK